jgi:hypothetical protein
MASICADAGVDHNDRKHPPIGLSEKAHNIVVLTQRYKQSPIQMDALIYSLDWWNMGDIPENNFG